MTARPAMIRIGNAQGFWGDRAGAAAELLRQEGELDYLTMDYLAEVSMSILAVQQSRDPQAGYARDFLEVIQSLAPYWAAGGRCKLITNAGGLNPRGCAEAVAQTLAQYGCGGLKIGVVAGDDVRAVMTGQPDEPLYRNLDNQDSFLEVVERVTTANAYLGAMPIVESLRQGADLVITGRVADPSMAVAPCLHEFGWDEEDWDRLAGATIAGHLIECGTQVTGGISTDWLDVPDPLHLGYPIVEVSADGSCVVTKPEGTGGRVTPATVKEQLLYEIGDPARYLSPDVTVSFLALQLQDLGDNRVRITGAQGRPRVPNLKVSATYPDGFRAAGTLTIFGHDAVAKARRSGEIVIKRLAELGIQFRHHVIECLGTGVCGAHADNHSAAFRETVLRIAVESERREDVERFSRELMPLVTAGPPGTTGYAEGRPRVHRVFRYWPCLVDRRQVSPAVELFDSPPPTSVATIWETNVALASEDQPRLAEQPLATPPRTLRDLVYARSGDKGTGANIGLIARDENCYPELCRRLTAEKVQEFLAPLVVESVERFELPNLAALNFVVKGVLRCGLKTDAQGKALGQALLEMPWE